MTPEIPLLDLAIAAGLGLIVGLQREHAASPLAGLRTFPLITLLGFSAALLGPWPLAAVTLALGLLVAIGVYTTADRQDPGITTEAAMLLMFAVGALLATDHRLLALAIGASTAVLLEFKGELHGFAAKLSHDDLRAIMRFVLLSLVVLPALPDRAYGPFDVLNPRQIWWMVVLVVGIDLAGYLSGKLWPESNLIWQGLLGGLISSTATTAAYARRVASASASRDLAALIIALASAVVFVRIGGELAAVSWPLWIQAAPGLGAVGAALALTIVWFWFRFRQRESAGRPASANPTELAGAFWFAGIYCAVLLASAAVRVYLGDTWLGLVSVIGGLTDVDAITLSMAHLVNTGKLEAPVAERMILIAAAANLVFKAALAAWIAGRDLAKNLSQIFAPAGILLLLLLLWR